ncbi:hypothetical protein [Bradyrhizobium sp. F1.13.3]|uniref:hypothetical protein n=1 Tax=Bradyrhizobium sp. F1.13.3 TaxID=3156351 RepID=UPI003398DEB9
MTTTLPARATALRERLVRLDRLGSSVAEASDLEGLRGDLAGRAEKLNTHVKNQAMLVDLAIAVPPPASLLAARKRAGGILERFRVQPKAATLKRVQAWRSMLDEIDTASRDLASAVIAAWRTYRQHVFAGDAPAVIRSRLARTKANDAAFSEYQRLFDRLKAAFETLPSDRAAIDRVKQLAADLEAVAQNFDFAVPAEVKQFLEAVLSVSGAPLALLTPEVVKWLKENDSFDNYRVSATGRG